MSLGCSLLDVPAAVRSLATRVRDLKKAATSGQAVGVEEPVQASATKADMSYAQIRGALRDAARLLNVALLDVPGRVTALRHEAVHLQQQLERLAAAGTVSAQSLLDGAVSVAGARVIVVEVPNANSNLMRQLIDQLRKQTDSVAVLLAAAQEDGKVILVAGITKDLIAKGVSAGKWVGEVAPVVGGGGGGKPDMAQAGGKDASQLPAALEQARRSIEQMLGARST